MIERASSRAAVSSRAIVATTAISNLALVRNVIQELRYSHDSAAHGGGECKCVRLSAENYSCCFALGYAGARAMGKFFLIIIAISVAVLLAMSAYVISL